MRGRLQLCKREILARRGAKALALFAWEDGARGGEGAGAVPLGRMVRRGGEGAGAVPLGWMCVVGKRSLWVE